MCGGGVVQGAKIFVNDQSRSLCALLAKCLEILCAAMPCSAAWIASGKQTKQIYTKKNNQLWLIGVSS